MRLFKKLGLRIKRRYVRLKRSLVDHEIADTKADLEQARGSGQWTRARDLAYYESELSAERNMLTALIRFLDVRLGSTDEHTIF